MTFYLNFLKHVYSAVYVYLIAAVGTLNAPFMVQKILYPFVVSPARFYAPQLGLIQPLWNPPGGWTETGLVLVLMSVYLYCLNFVVVKLLALKICRKSNNTVTSNNAKAMSYAPLAVFALFFFCPIALLYFYIISFPAWGILKWVPFWKCIAAGLPMMIVSLIILNSTHDSIISQSCR